MDNDGEENIDQNNRLEIGHHEKQSTGEKILSLSARFESLLNTIDGAVLITDRNGNIVLHKPSGTESMWFFPDDVTGRRIEEVMPESISEQFNRMFEILKNGGSAEFEYWIGRGGIKRWFSVRSSPIIVANRCEGMVLLIRDITEVKKLSELLKIVNGVLRAVIRSSEVEELIKSVSTELEEIKYPVCVVAIRSGDELITASKGIENLRVKLEDFEHVRCVIEAMETQKTIFRDESKEKCRTCVFDRDVGARYRYIFPISASKISYGGLIVFSFEKLPQDEIEILEKMAKDLALSIRAIKIDELEKFARNQVEENLVDMLLVIDRIRNPLTVITYLAEVGRDEGRTEVFERIMEEISRITEIIETLEMRWSASEELIKSIRQLIRR